MMRSAEAFARAAAMAAAMLKTGVVPIRQPSDPPIRTGDEPVLKLGNKARDTITGIEGIVVMRAEYLYGCVRVALQPTGTTNDGKPHDELFVDEQRAVLVADTAPQVSPDSTPGIPGGPQTYPMRPGAPQR